MTARPWMPFYVADYLADTQHLNNAEHGAYLLLMFYQWQHGAIPDDPELMARIARVQMQNFAGGLHMQNSEWDRIWRVLKPHFRLAKDGFIQGRLASEMEKAAAISGKRREAANVKHRKHNRKPKNGLHGVCSHDADGLHTPNSANAHTRARGLHNHIKNLPSSGRTSERPSPSEASKINGHPSPTSGPATALPDGRAGPLVEDSEASEPTNQPKPIAEQSAAELIEARKRKPNAEAKQS
jgi:uncharacterized protein YdaU (DUF1376 family)